MVLIGYWPLNETSGSTAYDHSGNSLHGTPTSGHRDNPDLGVSGVLGDTAYNFEPATDAGDYVSLSDENGQYPAQDLTITAWIYSEENGRRQSILDLNNAGSSNSSNDGGLVFRKDSGDFLQTYFHTSESHDNFLEGGDIPTGQWIYVAIVRDESAGEMRHHINGQIAASASKPSGNIIYDYGSYDDNSVNIGRWFRSGASHDGWNGKIQEVRLYNHALTPSEIQYMYSVSKRGKFVSDKK